MLSSLNSSLTNVQTQCNSGTVYNSARWGGKPYDVGTNNTTDTYILVEASDKVQHTLPSTILQLAGVSTYNKSVLTANSEFTINSANIAKYGKVVSLQISGVANKALSSYTTVKICNLPSYLRPAVECTGIAMAQGFYEHWRVEAYNGGDVFIWQWGGKEIGSGGSFVISLTFVSGS